MKKSYLLTLVLTISIAISGFANQPVLEQLENSSSHTLRYNPKVGTTGQIVMDYNLNIKMDMMGQTMDMDQVMEMGATMTVLENNSDGVKSGMTYDYMAMTMENPMTGTMTFDSREEENDDLFGAEMGKAFDEMIGKELTITQDKMGSTIESDLTEAVGSQGQGGLNLSSIMGMSQFPEKALSIGESWSNTVADESSPMKFDIVMTLKSVKNGKVYIDFDSEVTTNEDFISEEDVEMEMSGTQTGSFVYEESSMWLLEGLINQDLEMTVDQMGMSIPMQLTGEMMITVD
ncbi:MAG: hypothetical protein GY751_03580 [Bacteroidetes bacterium]|nr:hypothetical protein [Bacteroidota bacterium]